MYWCEEYINSSDGTIRTFQVTNVITPFLTQLQTMWIQSWFQSGANFTFTASLAAEERGGFDSFAVLGRQISCRGWLRTSFRYLIVFAESPRRLLIAASFSPLALNRITLIVYLQSCLLRDSTVRDGSSWTRSTE